MVRSGLDNENGICTSGKSGALSKIGCATLLLTPSLYSDNYDSFTWNVYQYLVLEGASVQVFRNDEISLDELIELEPTQLVISPGPGHPDLDAGISKPAIRHFAGRIPILGVCMGEYGVITLSIR